MKIALVGLGVIGKVHSKVICETDNDLVAVCDIDEEKLSLFPNVKGYTDYVKMLEESHPDVVHICTPHHLHTQMVLEALKRDIHVLCEKPLCIKEEDIPLILAAEKSSKAQLGVCFQNRYNAATLFAKEYLKDKKLISAHGRLMWHRDEVYYNQATWRGKKETEGGGVLINQALHTVDLLQYFMGAPKTLLATCENVSLQNVIEVEDTATVFCKGENEFSFMATNAAAKDYPVEIVFYTENESLRMLSNGVFINGVYRDCKTDGEAYGKKVYGAGHRGLILDFYDCIQTGRKFSIDGAEAAKAVKIVLAAYASKGYAYEIKP